MKKQVLFTSVLLLISSFSLIAQKSDKRRDVDITFEKIKEQCADIPLEDRIRITVARFSATAANAPDILGENMSTMLTNALSQVNCFNVLEETKNLDDMTGEIDMANSEYFDGAMAVEKGKMKMAQIIVTGEVTEYNDSETGTKVMGVGGSVAKARIGFILKIINPMTREILKSTSINTTSTTGKSFQVSFLSSSASSNPAVADALEKGIIQATEYLASEKDNIQFPSDEELNSSLTLLTINGVSFSQKNQVLAQIKTVPGVNSCELKSYSDNIATFAVRHTGSTDEFAITLDSKTSGMAEITGLSSGKISMAMK